MSGAPPPPRGVLIDLGYTLVRWEVPDAALLDSRGAAHGRIVAAHADREPPADLLLQVDRHVLAAARAAYERDRHTEVDHPALYGAALAHHGYPVSAEDSCELVAMQHAAFARHLTVSDATRETLAALRVRGLRLGLVSNAYTPGALMRHTLEALGLAGSFDVAVFSSELGIRKPHPGIYQHVLGALGVGAAEAVFVGDRVREDIVAPQALGMRAILTHEHRQEPPGEAVPDAVVAAFAEVPAVLDYLAGRTTNVVAPDRRMQ